MKSEPTLGRAATYAALYPDLVTAARTHGYALAIHGSLTRDFDLIAVPWTQEASEGLELIKSLQEVVGCCYRRSSIDEFFTDADPRSRPHLRRGYVIHLTDDGAKGPYLDISVMPRWQDYERAAYDIGSGTPG